MKKILFSMLVLGGMFCLRANAQVPCANAQVLENRIDAIENQGWVEISREFVPIFYFAAPTPPYLAGTMTVVFGPDCAPGDPCPAIARAWPVDVIVQNDHGTCRFDEVLR